MPQSNNLETEIKFLLRNPMKIEDQLINSDGKLIQPKTYEINYRLDSQDLRMRSENKVLRLRKDSTSRLTFKESGTYQDGICIREELEIPIGDIQTAIKIFEAIGFHIEQIYEKYRTIYRLNNISLMIDELPIGDFVELEGNNPDQIKKVAKYLGLFWDRHIPMGYLQIHNELNKLDNTQNKNMLFKGKFSSLHDLEKLDILPADIG